MQITDDSAAAFRTGSATIGATAVQLTSTSTKLTRGIVIKAPSANTGQVYIGTSSGVTALSTPATDGFQLSAGERQFIPVDDLSKIWLIASGAGQVVTFLAA